MLFPISFQTPTHHEVSSAVGSQTYTYLPPTHHEFHLPNSACTVGRERHSNSEIGMHETIYDSYN